MPQNHSTSHKGDTYVGVSLDVVTVKAFHRGVKRDKSHYEDLKDDKYFNTWNRDFVVTAHIYHTHFVLDDTYDPKMDVDIAVSKKCRHLCMPYLKTI
jgi:hypothetical protein